MNNMSQNPFDQLKVQVQEIIDLIAQKQNREANNKLTEVSEALDELLDHSDEDEDLIEISKYQVLLNQLFQKINPEDEQ
jgi:CRISPR/Cas system CSM-associated protein Csm2 small subunit